MTAKCCKGLIIDQQDISDLYAAISHGEDSTNSNNPGNITILLYIQTARIVVMEAVIYYSLKCNNISSVLDRFVMYFLCCIPVMIKSVVSNFEIISTFNV